MMVALDAGADDMVVNDDNFEILTDPAAFNDVHQAIKEAGYEIVSAEQTVGSVMLDTFIPEKGKRYAVVFGNEVSGVSQEVVDASDFALEIPQYGTKHSLNVSVSVGVILWHLRCRIPV